MLLQSISINTSIHSSKYPYIHISNQPSIHTHVHGTYTFQLCIIHRLSPIYHLTSITNHLSSIICHRHISSITPLCWLTGDQTFDIQPVIAVTDSANNPLDYDSISNISAHVVTSLSGDSEQRQIVIDIVFYHPSSIIYPL